MGLESRQLKKAKTSKPIRVMADKAAPAARRTAEATLKAKAARKAKSAGKWAGKMRKKERLMEVKAMSKQLREELQHEQQTAKDARKATRLRKAENERKSMVTQDIRNIRAVKKLSPRARRRARIFLKHELNK